MSSATPSEADGVLGGRKVGEDGLNSGMLRCPRCFARLISLKGELTERAGEAASLWIPKSETAAESDAAAEGTAYEWTCNTHTWWWMVEDVNDVDNVALTMNLPSPLGDCRMALCSDCRCGPLGYRLEGEARLWFACDLLRQQDAAFANDADDFKVPDGLDMSTLRAMIESGQATVSYKTTFDEKRLGMMLQDASDGMGVEVTAFTEYEGEIGPVERSGKVKLGDKVVRVNGKSTHGFNFATVLEMIIDAPRPVTIHWERQGHKPQAAARVVHADWKPYTNDMSKSPLHSE
eukprot:scaffold169533_cov39-Tisochrysis_lutea.AAC.1